MSAGSARSEGPVLAGPAAIVALLGGGCRMILDLPGWEDYSVWGWDEPEASLFAQLWPNLPDDATEEDEDERAWEQPRWWITPTKGYPQLGNPEELAAWISLRTRLPRGTVLRALAAFAPKVLKGILLGLADASGGSESPDEPGGFLAEHR